MSEENNLTKEQLLLRVQELEAELKRKQKYGLYWEDKDEDVVLECKNKYPVVRSVEHRRIRNNETDPVNVLIEGDNYHALQVLKYTHKGKVDVIYIDPPYNTGNKDFIYNDDFVGDDDGYRHSKWLSFMEKRLVLARELLSDTGVIFISIDDNEQAQLKLLCDGVFGERNFVANLTWIKKEKASGVPPRSMVIPNFEYVLVYQKKEPFSFKGQTRSMSSYKLDENGRYWRYMPIQATGNQNNYFDIIDPATDKKYYGNWALAKKTIDDLIQNNKLRFPKKDNGKPVRLVYADEMSSEGSAIFTALGKYDSETATKEFNSIFGEKVFDFPKPLDLIKFIVSQHHKSATILDFFAGSGTTGHAVLELNKEDGGNRKFILVTNNGDEKSEHKIAEKITYERLKKVMNGYTNKKGEHIQGLGGNLEYLRCELIEKDTHTDNLELSVIKNSTEMIALKEGIFEKNKVHPAYTILHNVTQGTAATYTSIDDSYIEEFKKDLENISGSKSVYVHKFIDYSEIFLGLKSIDIKELPEIK